MKKMKSLISLVAGLAALPALAKTEEAAPQQSYFWYARGGIESTGRTSQQPKETGNGLAIATYRSANSTINTNLGLLLETHTPVFAMQTRLDYLGRSDSTPAAWNSFQDSKDYEHFPLAWHRTERTLRAQYDLKYYVNEYLAFDLDGEYADVSSGSKILHTDRSIDTRPFNVGRRYYLKPGVTTSFSEDAQLSIYTLVLKNVDDLSSLDSYKTDKGPARNLGLIYRHHIHEPNLQLNAHAFHYTFIFNDPFQDITRRGLTLEGSHRMLAGTLALGLHATLWQDQYRLPLVGLGRCGAIVEQSSDIPMVQCNRTDMRQTFGTAVAYQLTERQQLSFNFDLQTNRNSKASLVNFDSQTFLLQYSFGRTSNQDLLPKDYEIGREALATKIP